MKDKRFYLYLHRQIPVFIALSVLPGLGYVFLGWLNNVFLPGFIWYLLVIAASIWGYQIYRNFDFDVMSEKSRSRWYRQCSYFFRAFFLLWALIFLLYVGHSESNLHYIAIFTEIGAAVVASSLLSSDRKLYQPTLLILMTPLIIYFFLIGEWYGYVLSIFSGTLLWVLLYAANSSYQLLKQAQHQATHDALTGLFNRQYFIEHLQKKMNTLNENNEFSYLQLIDLDHFKNVNDSLGHDIGDQLLQSVVIRLKEYMRPECTVARLGGDEFIITGGNYKSSEECVYKAKEISEILGSKLKEPYKVGSHQLYISASIGVSIISGSSLNANKFIKEADIAMYEVKAKGRDGVFIFNNEISARVEKYLEIEHELHSAISDQGIKLHFQPQLNRDGKIIGAESLARWDHPLLGNISPEDFIPIAEHTGLIINIGNHILETAFKTLKEWHNKGIQLEQFSINISMRQFTHQHFVTSVETLLSQHLTPELQHKLIFEITESIVAEDINRVINVIQQLNKHGIRFSMDDFGTGYSSLSYLSRLPLSEIKIDRSFVNALSLNDIDRAMVVTILNMAKTFKMKVVAEGVETIEQLNFLLNHDCEIFQGYFYSKALNMDDFQEYYLKHTSNKLS